MSVPIPLSPVLGSQDTPFNDTPYSEFIEESRQAAQRENIGIADANSEMKRHIDGLSEDEQFKLMYSDNWHVNDYGHKIYAECAMKKIKL